MTRQHATLQLLRHGELTFREFVDITGWSRSACARWLSAFVDTGEVLHPRRGIYVLAVA
ncbi:MAG: hypothetical protein JJD98_02705 [Polaromonas sp.]|nr:hypothetical protein [Polaromonas sp.]